MSNWWAEFRNPSLKCERVGHVEIIERQSGMRRPASGEWYRGVAVSFQDQRTVCRRCGAEISAPREIAARPINSWSAPQSIWDEFYENGRWISSHWKRV